MSLSPYTGGHYEEVGFRMQEVGLRQIFSTRRARPQT